MSAIKDELIRTVEAVMVDQGLDIRDSDSFEKIQSEILDDAL